jgi:hypothetical protein
MRNKIESLNSTRVSFDTYIIRLYRFQKNKPQRMLGVVEEIGAMKKSAFADYDELWTIINSSKVGRAQERKEDKK